MFNKEAIRWSWTETNTLKYMQSLVLYLCLSTFFISESKIHLSVAWTPSEGVWNYLIRKCLHVSKKLGILQVIHRKIYGSFYSSMSDPLGIFIDSEVQS